MLTDSNFSIDKARRLQVHLSEKLVLEDRLPASVKYVAGVDVAYVGRYSVGAVSVFDYETVRIIERQTSQQTTRFPYIPTLLSFRELPPAISAIDKLRIKPDIFLVDGHGLAHPRHFGFASHLGLVLDKPTIGVAKSLLCGEVEERNGGRWKPIVHEGKIAGGAVFTRPNVKPVYVSVGHKVSLETAIEIVLHCAGRHRVPEPIREAHLAAEGMKKIIGDKSLKKEG